MDARLQNCLHVAFPCMHALPMSPSNDQAPQDESTTDAAPRPASASSRSTTTKEVSTREDDVLALKAACETPLPEDYHNSGPDMTDEEFEKQLEEELEKRFEEDRKRRSEQQQKLLGGQRKELEEVRAKITKMVGIDPIKELFTTLKSRVEVRQALGLNDSREKFHALLQGNPGTGPSNCIGPQLPFWSAFYSLSLAGVRRASQN